MSVARGAASVLIVEDNAADAELTVEGLGGTSVHLAQDGREALEYLRDGGGSRPSLIMLDLNLPRPGGLETLTNLKTDPSLRCIAVIVLTTSKSSDEIRRCYELGAAAVLNKPMRLGDYRSMLDAFTRFWLEHVRFPAEPC